MLDPSIPTDAQRVVAAFLALVEAQTAADVYPASVRDLPHPKALIQSAFRTSVEALVSTGQLTLELRDYLEIAYVSLTDYLDDEGVTLLREYRRAGEALAADQRLAREKVSTEAWRQVTEQSRLAGELARAISAEAERLRVECRSWASRSVDGSVPPDTIADNEVANVRSPAV
ncbi:MAG: hypothetical protein HYU37_11575 [Acidobacteria bacterium]|nr:hypothetical protein [Acidobacteriota bacterium]